MNEQITETLTISIKGDAEHPTIEADGPGGIHADPLPFTAREKLLSKEHEATLVAMREEAGKVDSEAIQSLGETLYRAIFGRMPITMAFGKVAGLARAGGGKVRLRLHIEVPVLAALPWEAMHDEQDWFLAQDDVFMVRRFPHQIELPPQPLLANALKILFVGGFSPAGLPNLDAKIEKLARDLHWSLKESIDAEQIVFKSLLRASLDDIRTEMPQGYHVVCFAGHGEPDGVYLHDGYDGPKLATATELAHKGLLKNDSVRLIFLAACNTGTVPAGNMENLAQTLSVEACLPAVVAMQYYVSIGKAQPLVEQFFGSLAAFQPVDMALAYARRTILNKGSEVVRDVISPVLYLQAEDGTLFHRCLNPAERQLSIKLFKERLPELQDNLKDPNAPLRSNLEKSIEAAEDIKSIDQTLEQEAAEVLRKIIQRLGADLGTMLYAEGTANAFSPDGRWLVTANGGVVFFWHIAELHKANENRVVSALDKFCTLFDLNELMNEQVNINVLAFSADGCYLATGHKNGTVCIWHLPKAPETKVNTPKLEPLYGHTGVINILKFSPDGQFLVIVAGEAEKKMYLYHVENESDSELVLDASETSSAAFSPDGHWLATGGSKQGRSWCVDEPQAEPTRLYMHRAIFSRGHNTEVAFSPNGHWLATAGNNNKTLHLWRMSEGGQKLATTKALLLCRHKKSIKHLAFSPDNRWLATWSLHEMCLWDLSRAEAINLDQSQPVALEPVKCLRSNNRIYELIHCEYIRMHGLSPDGNWLVGTFNNKRGKEEVWLWSKQKGKGRPRILEQFKRDTWAFSPDGRWLVAENDNKWLQLLAVNSEPMPRDLCKVGVHKPSLKFSPDGSWLLVGIKNQRWDENHSVDRLMLFHTDRLESETMTLGELIELAKGLVNKLDEHPPQPFDPNNKEQSNDVLFLLFYILFFIAITIFLVLQDGKWSYDLLWGAAMLALFPSYLVYTPFKWLKSRWQE